MKVTFKEAAAPTVWLIRGTLGKHSFWYEYDERDGQATLEFDTTEPGEAYDGAKLYAACQAELEKSWAIVDQLSNVEVEQVIV